MKHSQSPKLSVSLALQALSEASEDVETLETQLDNARALRDEMIADAVYAGVSVGRIARLTKLSRQYIYRIAPGRLKTND